MQKCPWVKSLSICSAVFINIKLLTHSLARSLFQAHTDIASYSSGIAPLGRGQMLHHGCRQAHTELTLPSALLLPAPLHIHPLSHWPKHRHTGRMQHHLFLSVYWWRNINVPQSVCAFTSLSSVVSVPELIGCWGQTQVQCRGVNL